MHSFVQRSVLFLFQLDLSQSVELVEELREEVLLGVLRYGLYQLGLHYTQGGGGGGRGGRREETNADGEANGRMMEVRNW